MNDSYAGDPAPQDQPVPMPGPDPWAAGGQQQAVPTGQWQQAPQQSPQHWQQAQLPPAEQQWQQQPGQSPWQQAPLQQPAQQGWPPVVGQTQQAQTYPGSPYPGQPPLAQHYAAQPYPAQWPPAAPPKRRSKTGALVAVGAFAVIAATAVTLAVVLDGDDAPPAATVPRVLDIATKPTETWTVEMGAGADTEFLLAGYPVPVGDHQALVWADFDFYSWESEQADSEGWYDDFDAHYDLGFAAGTTYDEAYAAAEAAYADDWTADIAWPDYEDFWPDELSGEWSDEDPDYEGFYLGFDDALYGEEGTSRIPAPDPVDFVPSVALVDVADGTQVWTVDLTTIEPDADHTWWVDAVSSDDGATIFVAAYSLQADDDAHATTIAALDAVDGSVLSTTSIDDLTTMRAVEGALLLMGDSDGDDEDGVVRRMDSADLDGDALWEYTYTGEPSISSFAAGQVRIADAESTVVLSLADGTTVWAGDAAMSLGATVLTFERDKDSETASIEAETVSGESLWEESVEVATAWPLDGYLFAAATSADDDTTRTYGEIQRLDPATGEELWDTPLKKVSNIFGVADGTVVAISDGRLVLLDVQTGEEKSHHTLKGADGMEMVWIGTDNVYVQAGPSLLAYSLGEDGKQWTYAIPDVAYVFQVGQHLLVSDFEAGTLSGLGVR